MNTPLPPPLLPVPLLLYPLPNTSGILCFILCQQQRRHEKVQGSDGREEAAGRRQGEARFRDGWETVACFFCVGEVSPRLCCFSPSSPLQPLFREDFPRVVDTGNILSIWC